MTTNVPVNIAFTIRNEIAVLQFQVNHKAFERVVMVKRDGCLVAMN